MDFHITKELNVKDKKAKFGHHYQRVHLKLE
jgi:hypothetical protein